MDYNTIQEMHDELKRVIRAHEHFSQMINEMIEDRGEVPIAAMLILISTSILLKCAFKSKDNGICKQFESLEEFSKHVHDLATDDISKAWVESLFSKSPEVVLSTLTCIGHSILLGDIVVRQMMKDKS